MDNKKLDLKRFKYLLKKILAFLITIGVISIIIIGFIPISFPFLNNITKNVLIYSGVDSCSVGKVKLAMWRSITITDLYCEEAFEDDNDYSLKISEATINLNIIKAMWNRKKITDQLLSREPDLFRFFYFRPIRAIKELFLSDKLIPFVKKIAFSGLDFSLRSPAGESVNATDGKIIIKRGINPSENSNIKVSFKFLKISGEGLENIKCALKDLSENELSFQLFSAKYSDGIMSGRALIDVQNNIIKSYVLKINDMDLAYWYTLNVGDGEIGGRTDIFIEGADIPINNITLRGELRAVVKDCKIYDVSIMKSLATALFIPQMPAIKFDRINIRCIINKKDTINTYLNGQGDQLNLSMNGWIAINQSLYQNVEGIFSKKFMEMLPQYLKIALEKTKEEDYKFKCRLLGTLKDPRVEVDKEILERAIGNLIEDFKNNLLNPNTIKR
ncbi:MAG: hypothetical protein N2053_06525 [Chitinispirillaceae bacterium]|nr:hypothetical protein [Chitinispirillaceae bacterium]